MRGVKSVVNLKKVDTIFIYITNDVSNDIVGDIDLERWMRREAGVPRGLLRFLVLKFLAEKPMSGVEIVEEIEHETGGKWKPSSGSIYPPTAKCRSPHLTGHDINSATRKSDGTNRMNFQPWCGDKQENLACPGACRTCDATGSLCKRLLKRT